MQLLNQVDKEAVMEALKELGRIAFLGAVTAGVGWFTALVSSLDPTSAQFIVGTALLKVMDKFVHKSKKIKANGVAPF